VEWVGPKGQLNLLWRFTRFKKDTELENILNEYQAESGCSISSEKEIVKVTEELNPYWVAGFVSGKNI